MSKKVAVIMGSDSDLPVVKKAIDVLKSFDVPYTVHVLSAHRCPEQVAQFAKNAQAEGYGVMICAAGMAAHLAGAVTANCLLPVIAIPVKSKALDGMDALLSSVMMPPGMPVATVGIDGAANAGYLAVQMLAIADEGLAAKYADFRKAQTQKCLDADKNIYDKLNQL